MARSKKGRGMTYAGAGVDIDLKSECITALVDQLHDRRSGRWKRIELAGHFTGLIEFGDYALSLCTDGVGTKLMIAERLSKWDTVGIDCVAMNVNDTICVGAEPVAFVDYIAIDRPMPETLSEIGQGLQKAAETANMIVVGGEVAVMPDLVKGLDLSGTCLGIVKRSDIVTGSDCAPGDVVIGLPSSGIHSNGLTLARKVFEENGIDLGDRPKGLKRTVGEELLKPTRIYVREVLNALDRFKIDGMVNITGGGLRNLLRLKKGLGFCIDSPMRPQEIFRIMQKLGSIDDREMYQTFNMGMGFALVVPARNANKVLSVLGKGARAIGKVNDSGIVSVPEISLEYDRY